VFLSIEQAWWGGPAFVVQNRFTDAVFCFDCIPNSIAVDFISGMKSSHDEMAKEVDMLRQELSRLQKR